jgi:MFS family permease
MNLAYGVILNGFLSDRFGRKYTAYIFLVLNAIFNISVTVLVSFDFGLSPAVQQTLFGVLRFFCGCTANFYSIAVVLGKASSILISL